MTQTTHYCAWCNFSFPSEESKLFHEGGCEVMKEEMNKEAEKEERRQMENQLWEEEHAAGRC